MATLLTKNIGKFNTSLSDRRPLFPGDLINNDAVYSPTPDYTSDHFRKLSMNAELFCSIGSLGNAQYKNAFKPEAITSGYAAYQAALKYPKQIRQNTEARFGEEFLTIQRLSDSVPKDIVHAEVFAKNHLSSQHSAEVIAQNFPEYSLNLPSDREGFLRSIHEIHPILQSSNYEDYIFEKFIWGPEVLLDTNIAIYDGDKSYSRNGSLEQAIILAIQYASPVALNARDGHNIDVKDIIGRDISLVDQAWEDCKHLVDVVEMGFRSETAAALILSRFMHDDWFENKTGNILHDKVHPTIKNRSKADAKRMADLKKLMLPYIAEKCDWKTLHIILENDRGENLKKYWDENIAPLKNKTKPDPKILKKIFSYLPRGGWIHPEHYPLITSRRDKPSAQNSFIAAQSTNRIMGAHDDIFDPKWQSNLFEDDDFGRLGGMPNPGNPIDKNHLNANQSFAYIIANALRKARPPVKNPRTLLYLGSTKSGERATNFMYKNGISNPAEIDTVYDPLLQGDKTYAETTAVETNEYYNDRTLEILRNKKWCDEKKVGNIVPLSLFAEIEQEINKPRESLNTQRRQAVAADGSHKISPETIITCAKRYTDHQIHGIIIPPGALLDAAQYRLIMQAILVATGQIKRPYTGGEYDMEFFYDSDDGTPPRKIDLGDIIILMGETIEHFLNQPQSSNLRWHFLTMARVLDIYEKIIDPDRRNINTSMNPETGEIEKQKIISLRHIKPGFADFLFNDPKKAKKVHDIWFRLNQKSYPDITPNVRGLLKIKAIHNFDDYDLKDLPAEYQHAKKWFHNLSALQKQKIFQKNAVLVTGPTITKP